MTTQQQFILENFKQIETIEEIKVSDNLDAIEFIGIEIWNKYNLSIDLETYVEGLLQTTGITSYCLEDLTVETYCEYAGDDVEKDLIDYINDNLNDAKDVLKWHLSNLFELQQSEKTIYTPSKIAA